MYQTSSLTDLVRLKSGDRVAASGLGKHQSRIGAKDDYLMIVPSFYSLVPPVTTLETTALEVLAAGLLGRQTLFGDSLPLL